MTTTPTVYYGGVESSALTLHAPVENLLQHLKRNHSLKDDDYFKCPAFIDWAKDKLVLKSPCDIDINGDGSTYVQWFEGEFYLFADKEVNMTVYPPFLEKTNIQGVVAKYDISKWCRAVNPCTAIPSSGKVQVKQNQSLIYLGFDREVKIEKVIFPKEILSVVNTAMSYKFLNMKDRSLKKLYDNFMSNRSSKVLLKIIKDYNDL